MVPGGRILHKEAVKAHIQSQRRRVQATWDKFPQARRFLQDHYPEEWEEARECRQHYRIYRSIEDRRAHKVTPYSCWNIPYCIPCTVSRNVQRTFTALDNFARVTPNGRKPAFVHIVMTAPYTESGEGWGVEASQDVPKFAAVIRKSLMEIYGPDIGGLMSYQDFGERAFDKRMPHMDLTLNGYLVGGEIRDLPRVQLQDGGRARVDAITQKYARAFRLDAHPSNPWFGRRVEGFQAYYRTLRYQMREMVDFRKLDYDRKTQNVWWKSYKDNSRTKMTVPEFMGGLLEYQERLGAHQGVAEGRVELHRYFGYMAKRSLHAIQDRVGGGRLRHRRGCQCGDCMDWERVTVEDLARGDRPPVEVEDG